MHIELKSFRSTRPKTTDWETFFFEFIAVYYRRSLLMPQRDIYISDNELVVGMIAGLQNEF
jgi:hypothetical protein